MAATTKYDERYSAAVDAAAAVFAEKGYHAASTVDIADRLNIKQGSLYYYFRSKEAALEAVCLAGIEHQVEHLKALQAANKPFRVVVNDILEYTLTSLRERADYMIVFNNDRKSIPLERRGKVRAQSHTYHKLLEEIFSTAQQQGELKSHLDIHITVRAFTSFLSSVFNWYRAEPDIDLDTVAELYAEIFLAGAAVSSP